MNEIATPNDIIDKLVDYQQDRFVFFRGQGDSSWELTPKAGRKGLKITNDKDLFVAWKKWAALDPSIASLSDEFSCLAIAQHHGLATRLLDWSRNPLAALYFAVSIEEEKNGALYVLKTEKEGKQKTPALFDEKVSCWHVEPSTVSPRIGRQVGAFTVHNPPGTDLKNYETSDSNIETLTEYVIPAKEKINIQKVLSFWHVNEYSLFPDLDGLAKHFNWLSKIDVQFERSE